MGYYNLREDISSDYHVRMDSSCNGGENECNRDFHLYKLSEINALLIVADPKCEACRFDPEFDVGPVEVEDSRENCELPRRYRKRQEKSCFATDDNEISECNSGSMRLSYGTAELIAALLAPLIT